MTFIREKSFRLPKGELVNQKGNIVNLSMMLGMGRMSVPTLKPLARMFSSTLNESTCRKIISPKGEV